MAFPENTVNDTGIKHIWDKVTAALSGKVDKVSGKGLSTNDYTTAEKDKLAGIESGAQANTVTSVAGKTGAVTLDKADVGLGNVDNTSDASKPISTATQNALNTKADASDVAGTQTATGNPITITDGSETYAQGLTVGLEPIQDLHGYDFPWVGGAGKNKLPLDLAYMKTANTTGTWNGSSYTVSGVTYTILYDNDGNAIGVNVDGTATADTRLILAMYTLKAGTDMYINGSPVAGEANTIRFGYQGYGYIKEANGQVRLGRSSAGTDWRNDVYIGVSSGYTVNSVTFKPMIRFTSETDPTFTPWENKCPISGYEGVEVEDVGKNLVDYTKNLPSSYANVTASENEDGTVQVTGTASTTFGISLYDISASDLPSGQYIISMGGEFTYYANAYNGSSFVRQIIMTSNPYTINLNYADYDHVLIEAVVNGSETYNKKIYPMIRKASDTDATFEPYHSSNATIQFGQTVYGGMSNFTEGGTDDEWNKDDTFSGWYKSSTETSVIIKEITDKKGGTNQIYSNTYKYVSNQGFAVPEGAISDSTNSSYTTYVFVKDSRFAGKTVQECQAILESDGMYFVYQVETPTTISTPPTDLKLLKGTNNLTTNGTTITLDYIPNNSIGDAVKASEEYTDRVVERVAVVPKATLIDTWMISEEADTISVDLSSYDCNFFLLEYLFQSKRGTTLIPRPQGGSFSASVVTYNNGTPYYIELDYNPTTKELAYTSNVTSQFGILAIYTI